MDKIIWHEDLSVGDKTMDWQHQKIIAMINSLIDEQDIDCHSEYLSDLLNTMTAYSLQHLNDEEKMLQQFNYPDLEQHIALHNDYRLKVVKFCTATTAGIDVTPNILTYLSEWWIHHICKEDKKYCVYMEDNRTVLTP